MVMRAVMAWIPSDPGENCSHRRDADAGDELQLSAGGGSLRRNIGHDRLGP